MQRLLWSFVVEQLKKQAVAWLEKHALDDNGCIARVLALVESGTLDDALQDDFWGTFGCLAETLARVVLATLSDFHEPHPDDLNVVGCDCKLSDDQMSQVFALGSALGKPVPATGDAEAINPALWAIVLELIKLFLESRK